MKGRRDRKSHRQLAPSCWTCRFCVCSCLLRLLVLAIHKVSDELQECWTVWVVFTQYYFLCFPTDLLRSSRNRRRMTDCSFTQARFLISAEVRYLQCYLVVTWLVPRETAAISAHILCRLHRTKQHQFTALFEAA